MRLHPQRPSDEHSGDHVVVFDIETVVDPEPADGEFPKWPLHRPVVASFLAASIGDPAYTFRLTSLVCTPGQEGEFYVAVNALLPPNVTSIGFNSKGFDLPTLQLGAMAAHRFELGGLSHHAHAHRFGRMHCDLADMYSLYGATKRPSLAEVCDRLGVPVKTSTHGSDVAALWRAGEIDAITRYCEEDVVATWCAWLAHYAARHGDDGLIARPLADFARWVETSPRLGHLLPFATCPLALWARARALGVHASRAARAAEIRREHARDAKRFVPSSTF